MEVDRNSANETDGDLLARYKTGHDPAVAGELYQRYMPLVYGVCLKYLKDREESRDAVMMIYEKLLVVLKTHEVHNFRSWLHTLARNFCLMKLRSEKGRHFEEISIGLMETDGQMHPENELDLTQDISRLERCLETLNAEQQRCVRLFYYEEKCYREIETLTGFDNKKVKSHIQNGKRNLKICMERDE